MARITLEISAFSSRSRSSSFLDSSCSKANVPPLLLPSIQNSFLNVFSTSGRFWAISISRESPRSVTMFTMASSRGAALPIKEVFTSTAPLRMQVTAFAVAMFKLSEQVTERSAFWPSSFKTARMPSISESNSSGSIIPAVSSKSTIFAPAFTAQRIILQRNSFSLLVASLQ